MPYNKKNIQGFTLIEISIVLVLIAIIVGATMSATNLIGASKLKTVITDGKEYHQAYDMFKERFKFPPGDFSGASKYWGLDCDGATSGDNVCDGGGNYEINDGLAAAGNPFQTLDSTESIVAWKHLVKADLIAGSYTGLEGSPATCSGNYSCIEVGENAPKAKYGDGVGFYLVTDSAGTETAIIAGKNNHTGWNSSPFLSAKDSQYIDRKIDDEVPDSGYFRAKSITGYTISGGGCTSGSAYVLTSTAEVCGAIFVVDGL